MPNGCCIVAAPKLTPANDVVGGWLIYSPATIFLVFTGNKPAPQVELPSW